MRIHKNGDCKLILNGVEKMLLDFVPVCDVVSPDELPCLVGYKVVEVDFASFIGD